MGKSTINDRKCLNKTIAAEIFLPDLGWKTRGVARLSAGPAAVEIVLGGSHKSVAARRLEPRKKT